MMQNFSESPGLAFFSRTSWASFFADSSPPQKLWRWFFPCLVVAFALRVIVGLSNDFLIRPDELYQYLEQAHRWVFGYGQVHWESRFGVRTWLLPAITALPLWLCKILGLGHPDIYIPAVRIWHALLSMSIPVGLYFFSRRTISETTARLAFLVGCFWHEFIIFGTHAVAEQYATWAFFTALALLSPSARKPQLLMVGFFLGLTIALRFAYLPIVGIFGLALLFAYPWRQWLIIVAGGLLALIVWGAVDYFSWGRWWHSIRLYLDLFFFNEIFNVTDKSDSNPFVVFIDLGLFIWNTSVGLYLLALLAIFNYRRYWLILSLVLTLLLMHFISTNEVTNLEYSNIFILWPLLWILITAVLTQGVTFPLKRKLRVSPKLFVAWALIATIAGMVNGLPSAFGKPINFYATDTGAAISRHLSRVSPDNISAVLWIGSGYYNSGTYYYLHHRVPNLFSENLLYHHEMIKVRLDKHAKSPADVNRLISHIVAPNAKPIAGFVRGKVFGDYAIFTAEENPAPPIAFEYFPTDMLVRGWANAESKMREAGVFFPEPKLSWLHEDYEGPF